MVREDDCLVQHPPTESLVGDRSRGGNIPGVYGSGDPGDCFLIATARVRRLSLVTRDTKIIALAKRERDYLDVIVC